MLLPCVAALCGCTEFDVLNATVPTLGYSRSINIAYGPLPRQSLDVYRPWHATQPADIVIFFYGGHWQSGQKRDYRFVAQALTSRGFIAVLPDYRLYPDVTFPAFVEDGAHAVRWVHDHAQQLGGDPGHIFLMGHSAGAHIAALLTLDPHYLRSVGLDRADIRATTALSGPYDFTPMPDDRAVFGMTDAQMRPSPAAEPIEFADGREPPMLLIHGLADQTVDPGNSARLAQRIHLAGGDVQYIAYPGNGHVQIVLSLAWAFRGIAPTLNDVTAFFRRFDREPTQTRPTR